MSVVRPSRPTVVSAAASEPLTLAEAKKQAEIASGVTVHDTQLTEMISEVREQWEHDTDSVMITQTLSVTLDAFCDPFMLPVKPIQSLTSITYYDGANSSQTLSTDIYELDPTNRMVRLKYNQTYPTTASRWDAVTVTFVAGYGVASAVPSIAKRAMLLQVGKWFNHTDMTHGSAFAHDAEYNRLVSRFIRSTYP